MTNFRKNTDTSPAIRLQKQAMLPTAADIVQMANEASRARKRVELLWQPEGRPEPVVLTIRPNDAGGKSSWILYNNPRADAIVVWSADDADAERVITAMRDWYHYARATEGWCKDPNMPLPYVVSPQPSSAPVPPVPPQGAEPQVPQYPGAAPYQPYPVSYPPYPPANAGYPAPAGWMPGAPYPPYGYPFPQTVPPHWTQFPQPLSAAPVVEPQNVPLSPEEWARLSQPSVAPPVQPGLLLGEVLVAAGLIPTQTLQAALTLQNAAVEPGARKKIGSILVSFGALQKGMLDAAIKLQEMARRGLIHPSRISDLLSQVQASNGNLDAVLAGTQTPPVVNGNGIKPPELPGTGRPLARGDAALQREGQVSDADREKLKQVLELFKTPLLQGDGGQSAARQTMELFRQAAILKQADVDSCSKPGSPIMDVIKAVLVKELLDVNTFKAGLDCVRMMSDDRLKREQAIIALLYCHRSRVGLRDAISDMNWDIPIEDV